MTWGTSHPFRKVATKPATQFERSAHPEGELGQPLTAEEEKIRRRIFNKSGKHRKMIKFNGGNAW